MRQNQNDLWITSMTMLKWCTLKEGRRSSQYSLMVHAVNVLVEELRVQEAVAPVEDEVLNDEVQQQLATNCLPGNRQQANSVRNRYGVISCSCKFAWKPQVDSPSSESAWRTDKLFRNACTYLHYKALKMRRKSELCTETTVSTVIDRE